MKTDLLKLMPNIVVFCLSLLFLLSLLFTKNNINLQSEKLSGLQKTPFSTQLHYQLAELYYQTGKIVSSENELALIKNNAQVMGVTTVTPYQFYSLEEQIKNQYAYYKFWREIITKYPGYRDGWIQLLYLAYQINDRENLKVYLQKIQELDPYYIQKLPLEIKEIN